MVLSAMSFSEEWHLKITLFYNSYLLYLMRKEKNDLVLNIKLVYSKKCLFKKFLPGHHSEKIKLTINFAQSNLLGSSLLRLFKYDDVHIVQFSSNKQYSYYIFDDISRDITRTSCFVVRSEVAQIFDQFEQTSVIVSHQQMNGV